ncbi:CPBP family intramembrane glutamic endopeptidase [Bacillus sp. FSL K6-3431]|uniref:CPBP family intramembrane glutamic endopeptidase n=1 Tax=Bacillus sp. FSL K6-3431 TaxID=2921500 RepID=UPI0030FBAF07
MKKRYIYIVITFISMHLSTYIGFPLLLLIGTKVFHADLNDMKVLAAGLWVVISFSVGLAIVLLLLKKATPYTKIEKSKPLSASSSINWAIGGIFLAFISQIAAVLVEQVLGIEAGSQNTQNIMNLIRVVPMVVIASSILGPILEEIVFRKVIFGTLYNRFPFWVSALISALIFSLAHQEPKHLIIYAAMGFTFSFLYVKTGRIIVPIISHVAMNTIVTIGQFKLPTNQEVVGLLHSWMGGLF